MQEDPENENGSLLKNLPFRGFLFVCVTYAFVLYGMYDTWTYNEEYDDIIASDIQWTYIISVFGVLLSIWDFLEVRRSKTARYLAIAWGIMSIMLGPFFRLLNLWLIHQPGFRVDY